MKYAYILTYSARYDRALVIENTRNFLKVVYAKLSRNRKGQTKTEYIADCIPWREVIMAIEYQN